LKMGSESPIILVVDDDELDAMLTVRALGSVSSESEILQVDDGEHALSELQRMADQPSAEWPVLALMDYRMPRLGCFDILRRFGRRDFLDQVPVVLFSSSVSPAEVDRCLEIGVRDYVEKPTDPDRYRHAVADIYRRHARML
jgi:CheY-like chemotaxis protein